MTPTISDIIDQIHTARDWLSAGDQDRHGKAVKVGGSLFGTLLVELDTRQIVVWRIERWQVYFVLRGLKKSGLTV
jgi:hypothetical protein